MDTTQSYTFTIFIMQASSVGLKKCQKSCVKSSIYIDQTVFMYIPYSLFSEKWCTKNYLSILPPDSIGIRHHVHHHLLRRVFPIRKCLQVNLHRWGKQMLKSTSASPVKGNVPSVDLPFVFAHWKVLLSSYMNFEFLEQFYLLVPKLPRPELNLQAVKIPEYTLYMVKSCTNW